MRVPSEKGDRIMGALNVLGGEPRRAASDGQRRRIDDVTDNLWREAYTRVSRCRRQSRRRK